MSLFDFLKKTGCYKNKEFYIITRCPFCGDSKRRRYNHGHLYIYKDNWTFKCFRCGKYGNMKQLLIEYMKNNILTSEENLNKILNKTSTDRNLTLVNATSRLYIPKQKVIKGKKLVYVANRFHMNEHEVDIDKYRIIFDLETFFKYNQILVDKYNLTKSTISRLDKYYVGFVSKYATKIILRAIDYNIKPRYIQYGLKGNLFSKIDHYSVYDDYTIFNSKEIIVAEGIFDINNKLLNKYFDENIPRLALLGRARLLNLNNIINFSYMDKIPHIIYLIDKDLLNEVYHIKYILSKCAYKVTIYKNVHGKDFGEDVILPEKVIYS